MLTTEIKDEGFPNSPVVKNSPCNAWDTAQGTKILRAVVQLSPRLQILGEEEST